MSAQQSAGKDSTFPANYADFCRFCGLNLRPNRQLAGCYDIFAPPKEPKEGEAKEPSLFERLSEIGVVLVQREGASHRMCKKCFSNIKHIEKGLRFLKPWQQIDDRDFKPTTTTTDASLRQQTPTKQTTVPENQEALAKTPEAVENEKRLREPTPTKTPRAVKKLCSTSSARGLQVALQSSARRLQEPRARTSDAKVTVTYTSRKDKPSNLHCKEDVAGIVENLAKGQVKAAARLMMTCDSLSQELKSQMLQIVETECRNLTSTDNKFLLNRCTAQDLQQFSLTSLHSDLERLAPFALSVLDTISKQSISHSSASAAVSLRGRDKRLSGFSYYINSVLQHGGGGEDSCFQPLK
ncbi:Hypp6666 [Branchiostoma lanceolatum]|uniref:Hypp6666 protein n=1 Tax=Branchiostoma lanceolatum TaxID=7740 RepID=A0A8J9YVB3_BRALA|nr:Hypp6666 [Branchiostoma lanceolatum]